MDGFAWSDGTKPERSSRYILHEQDQQAQQAQAQQAQAQQEQTQAQQEQTQAQQAQAQQAQAQQAQAQQAQAQQAQAQQQAQEGCQSTVSVALETRPGWRPEQFPGTDGGARVSTNERLGERQPVPRSGSNPFLAGSSYLDGLALQEAFLTPKSSHSEEV